MDGKTILIVILFVYGCLVIRFGTWRTGSPVLERPEKPQAVSTSRWIRGNPHYKQGQQAFRSGIPATANPAVDDLLFDNGTMWLRGWMDAKAETAGE